SNVAFQGGAESVSALLSEDVDMILAHPAEIMQHIDSDDFEALTVLGDESPYLEDTPAAKDLGYEVDMSISKFVMGPEGMDGEVRKKLQDIFEKSWESDE